MKIEWHDAANEAHRKLSPGCPEVFWGYKRVTTMHCLHGPGLGGHTDEHTRWNPRR